MKKITFLHEARRKGRGFIAPPPPPHSIEKNFEVKLQLAWWKTYVKDKFLNLKISVSIENFNLFFTFLTIIKHFKLTSF